MTGVKAWERKEAGVKCYIYKAVLVILKELMHFLKAQLSFNDKTAGEPPAIKQSPATMQPDAPHSTISLV